MSSCFIIIFELENSVSKLLPQLTLEKVDPLVCVNATSKPILLQHNTSHDIHSQHFSAYINHSNQLVSGKPHHNLVLLPALKIAMFTSYIELYKVRKCSLVVVCCTYAALVVCGKIWCSVEQHEGNDHCAGYLPHTPIIIVPDASSDAFSTFRE